MVSVDVKHHVYLLTDLSGPLVYGCVPFSTSKGCFSFLRASFMALFFLHKPSSNARKINGTGYPLSLAFPVIHPAYQ